MVNFPQCEHRAARISNVEWVIEGVRGEAWKQRQELPIPSHLNLLTSETVGNARVKGVMILNGVARRNF